MTSQITKRYAVACFKVAQEKKALKKVHDDLEILEAIASKFKKIFTEINSPISNKKERFLFVETLFKAYKFNSITKNLLSLLAENRCINLLEQISQHWKNLYLDFKNEAKLEVISVKKMKDSDLNDIKNFFEKEFGKKVQLKNTLDTSILGGAIIKSGSFVLDNSIANKIREIGFTLKGEAQ